MQLHCVRIGRSPRLLITLVGLSLSVTLQSCTRAEGQPDADSIHRLNVADEDPESARQPLAAVLDLDYSKELSWWTWREVLLSRLRHHQFEDLDEFADEARATRGRFPGGDWKLFNIYDVTNEPAAGADVTEEEWQAHLGLFEDWIQKYPDSATARAAYADTWVRYAWHARGPRAARDLSATQKKLFAERLERAKDGGPADSPLAPSQAAIQLLGRQLAAGGRKRVRDKQSLAGDTFSGGAEPIGCGQADPIHAGRLSQARLSIMSG